MPRPTAPCTTCGAPMLRGKGSRPAGAGQCLQCRREANPPATCIDCGGSATSLRCRDCYFNSKRIYGTDHAKGRRALREKIIGLTKMKQRRLLHKWQSQGRTCTFCDSPCESIDHVIPLARGGTNYEGNLTPACIKCNSSRGARTVMEWRLGRTQFKSSQAWVLREPRIKKPSPLPITYDRQCDECALSFTTNKPNKLTCSQACSSARRVRRAREISRTRYRSTVGIPSDAPLYWARSGKPTARSAA